MRRPALYGLALVCVSLVFALNGLSAQRLATSDELGGSMTPVTEAASSSESCDLSNHTLAIGSEMGLLESQQPYSAITPYSCVPASDCCKICSKGKACGNTCIRSDYTCHVGRGCACNQSEVCPG